MEQQLEEGAELRRYLLGEATFEEQVSVEARLFLDDDYSSQLSAVEDELIDDYVYDDLAAGERERVKSRLLPKPGRREDLRIARAFKRYLSHRDELVTPPVAPAADTLSASDAPDTREPASPPDKGPFSFLSSLFLSRPVVGYALAAAALLILSVVVWFSLGSLRGQSQSPDMRAQEPSPRQVKPVEREQPGSEPQASPSPPGQGGDVAHSGDRTQQGAGDKEKEQRAEQREAQPREAPPRNRQTPTQVATFLVLPGGGVRGPGASEKVTLSPKVGVVVLRVPLVAKVAYPRYRATLGEGDRVVYSRDDLKPEDDAEAGQVVALKVPAELLRPRRYLIKIVGVAASGQTRELNSYAFEVERQ